MCGHRFYSVSTTNNITVFIMCFGRKRRGKIAKLGRGVGGKKSPGFLKNVFGGGRKGAKRPKMSGFFKKKAKPSFKKAVPKSPFKRSPKKSPAKPSPIKKSPAKPSPIKKSPAKPSPIKKSPAKPSPIKKSPAKPSPIKKSPAKPSPIKKTPAKPSPIKKTPAKPSPINKSPAKPSPIKKSPVKPSPIKKTPAEPSPIKKTPAKPSPINKSPAKPSPIKKSPVKPSPIKKTPAEPSPIKKSPAKPSPIKKTPAEPSLINKSPAKPSPIKKTPAEPSPIKKPPAKPSPIKKTPAEPSPIKKSPAKPSPIKKTPAEPSPIKKSPAEPSSIKKSPAKPSPTNPSPVKQSTESHHFEMPSLPQLPAIFGGSQDQSTGRAPLIQINIGGGKPPSPTADDDESQVDEVPPSEVEPVAEMADASEQKAQQLMTEAEKKLKKTGGLLGKILGNSDSPSEAAGIFIKAANHFKLAKNWNDAGGAFLKAAQLYDRDTKHDAAMNYGEAGNCYRKVDLQKAVDCYQKSADIYLDMGRFNMAAKMHTTLAELYEATLGENEAARNTTVLSADVCKDKCLEQYQKAADMYKGEEQRSSASKCLIKVATYAADLEQYQRAQLTFEEVAIYEADNNILKYSAKTHFFQAILCSLCIDLLDSQRALKRYEELSNQFADSRECQLVKQLMQAMENEDPDAFTEAVQNFDKVNRLDQWHVAMLVKVKRRCGDSGDVYNAKNAAAGGAQEPDDMYDLR